MTTLRRRSIALLLAAAPLCALGASTEAPVPPVYFSHLFVVLDAASYDAIRDSPLIASLAATEESHVDAGATGWTGFYISGRRTYIELFSAKVPPPDGKEGDTGLGLTVEAVGGVPALAARLRPSFGDRVTVPAQRATLADGHSVPWYIAVELDGTKTPPAMETWVMETDPGYLAAKHPGARIDDPLSRERYQSWKYQPQKAFEDVVGVRAALAPLERSELETQLRAAGWAIEPRAGGFVARGPDVTLDVVPAGKRAGIQEITLRMAHRVDRQSVTLGQATLELDGLEGRLAFWPRE